MRGFAVLALLMVLGNQEGEEKAPPVQPEAVASVSRTHLRLKLERVLLDRYLLPFDAWVRVKGYDALRCQKEPLWYALVITDKPHKGPPVWVKFSLDPRKGYSSCSGCESCWAGERKECHGAWNPEPWIARTRQMLALSLEQHFIELMDNPEAVQTVKYGKARFYRIPGRDSDVTKLSPRQAIY